MKARIPIARPDLGEQEKENVRKCVESGWLSQGPWVERAEAKLREITGRKYAICTSSGTAALIASLMACGPHFPDEEIPVPAFTFAAVHNAVHIVGAVPVFMASDPETWQVSDEEASRFADHKVIVAATNYGKVQGGGPSSSDGIAINDVAESFGGSITGFPAGALGTVACCSFYCNKIVTSIEGGAILTDREDLAEKTRCIINHGISGKSYVSKYIGLNGRLTDLAASILCAQLDRMPGMLMRRRVIMAQYRDAAGSEWTFPTRAAGEKPASWLFAGIHTDVKDVQRRADAANIEWRPFFPVPKEAGEMKETRFISENGICLPLSSTLTDSEVSRVCELIAGR